MSALTAKALLHNLDARDYGRPLDELRDLFWSAPRLPLLPEGEKDLQRAIHEAVTNGQLRLVGADGTQRTVTRPADIATGSSGLRLAAPKPVDPPAPASTDDIAHPSATGPVSTGVQGTARQVPATAATTSPAPTGTPAVALAATEREIAFSLMTSMADAATQDAVRRLLLDLSNAADEGKISWAQIQVKVVVKEDIADELEKGVRDTGTTPSSRAV